MQVTTTSPSNNEAEDPAPREDVFFLLPSSLSAQQQPPPVSEFFRFLILTIACFGMMCASFGYAFNLITPVIQSDYGYSQREMSSITTVGLVLGYCMLPFAFLFDYVGPLPIAVLSMAMYPLGCVLTALTFQGWISPTVVKLCVFNGIQSIGLSLTDMVCCMVTLSYFPTHRGPVIALLKTYLGLGSAIVGSLYAGYFHGDKSSYLYFLTALSFIVNTLCAVFLRLPRYHLTGYAQSHLPDEEKKKRMATKMSYLRQGPPMLRFYFGFVILVVLIIYLPTETALVNYLGLSTTYKTGFAVVTTVVTLLNIWMAVPLPCLRAWMRGPPPKDLAQEYSVSSASSSLFTSPLDPQEQQQQQDEEDEEVGEEPIVDPHHQKQSEQDDQIVVEGRVAGVPETEVDYLAPQYQGTFIQNLKTLELWSLWWTMFCVIGTEFVIIYNATFILAALAREDPPAATTNLLTVLNGVGSAVGRLLMSYFEVWTQKRRAEDRIPITVSLFLPSTSIIITLVLFLTLPAVALPLPYVVAALGNGFLAATMVLVTRTIYAQDPAKHYNFCFSATMMSTIALNRFLYGEWYTVQAEKQNHANKRCYGRGCVQMPLLVLLGLCCSAFLSNVVVHFRYRGYCQRVLRERARLRGEGAAHDENNNNNNNMSVEQKEEGGEGVVEEPLDDGLQSSP